MIQLEINNNKYPLKSKWSELSKEDLLEICRIQLLPLDESYKRLMIFTYLTDIDYKKLQEIKPEALSEILELLNYLFKESRLLVNPFPEIGKMKGPEPGLTNFTFEQFLGQSEPYYTLCLQNGKDEDMDNLIRVMYNYAGDEENNELLKSLYPAHKLAIYYYYQGCSAFIKLKFKSVFTSPSKNEKPDGLEFTRLVNQLNNNDISKNEKIKSTNLYEALTYLQTIIDGK